MTVFEQLAMYQLELVVQLVPSKFLQFICLLLLNLQANISDKISVMES